jgi:EAL domain-containing protein (putative c-di-GMP-specific phosphodiesterase class I)/GGDEF domain-containing protein
VYSLKQELRHRFVFSLRAALPVVFLVALLVVVILERRSFVYNIIILFLGLFASIYFIYYMLFSNIRQKIIDETTKAFDNHYFLQLLGRFKGDMAVLISIDNIKQINERYGINNRDQILTQFARLIDRFFYESCHKEVPIGRGGEGDFFVILPKGCNAQEVLNKFLKRYDHLFINDIEIKVVGTVEQIEQRDPKRVVDRLYEKLYYSQERYRYPSKIHEREQIEQIVAQSIEKERLTLLFQPVLSLESGKYEMADTIVKLVDEKERLIHPSTYIPIINRMGLENRFDLILSKKLLHTIASQDLPTIRLAFHISPYSLRNRRFTYHFFELFEQSDIPKERFIIKLFEPSFSSRETKRSKNIISLYRDAGFLVGFDNFGACNAAMEYIKEIDADYLFFDKIFTKKLNDSRYYLLLYSWISFASEFGMKSVIKFVDDKQRAKQFAAMGAHYAMGYGIARPMMADELKRFIKEHNAIR